MRLYCWMKCLAVIMTDADADETFLSDAIANGFAPPYQYTYAYAWGGPVIRARFRQRAEDFQVVEELGFSLSGCGEHACVLIEKTAANTEWVARQLARFSGVRPRDIGYAGLKDRQAVTRQWFSILLPGRRAPDWDAFSAEGCRILETGWNSRKLRRGVLRCNHFRIVLRDIQGDPDQVAERLAAIRTHGFPNYFAEQRFGRNGNNLIEVLELFASGKRMRASHRRGLLLSAARAWLFNRVLDQRVRQGSWQQVLEGDVAMLDGSNSVFVATEASELQDRAARLDIHPTGPLWGLGEHRVQGEPAKLEQQLMEAFPQWCQGLERHRMNMDRRALRCVANDLELEVIDAATLALSFSLPSGSYATALLREIAQVHGGHA